MNRWEIAALVVIAAAVPCLAVCVLADISAALAAVEVSATLAVTALMLLSQGFHRQPFVDLAVVLALVSTVGSLTFARMMERDL
ncbi:MAG TPA: monovalent cation/H+ antiporter complex subunit F [Solirubrobacteraceae bacterium]|jgi:multisubunit Na+/H+ antiporter MnhF subunit|nr:monovalent cation/H+ antiporter complex subunit F [Solirubrobacteraceae bacterium]